MPDANGHLEHPGQPVIYAELLPNIRSVSVYVHLHTPRTSETYLDLAVDGDIVVLHHEGIMVQLALPINVVVASADKPLPISYINPHEMTLRLRPQSDALNDFLESHDLPSDNVVPWSASTLPDCINIHCLKCRSIIVVDSIKTWQDLPSAGWAEMMDFWHCHKPVDHKHRQQDGRGKGYGAGNVLTARSGTGFVDLTTLLLSPEDCCEIKYFNDGIGNHTWLNCIHCETTIGFVDDSASGWRLFKYCLSITLKNSSLPRQYLPEQWLAAQILSIMESQSSRKFIIKQEASPKHNLLIWLFTPDFWFSARKQMEPGRSGTFIGRAAKVMYKTITNVEKTTLANQVGVEEIDLHEDIQRLLLEALSTNQLLLAPSAKQFKDWELRQEENSTACCIDVVTMNPDTDEMPSSTILMDCRSLPRHRRRSSAIAWLKASLPRLGTFWRPLKDEDKPAEDPKDSGIATPPSETIFDDYTIASTPRSHRNSASLGPDDNKAEAPNLYTPADTPDKRNSLGSISSKVTDPDDCVRQGPSGEYSTLPIESNTAQSSQTTSISTQATEQSALHSLETVPIFVYWPFDRANQGVDTGASTTYVHHRHRRTAWQVYDLAEYDPDTGLLIATRRGPQFMSGALPNEDEAGALHVEHADEDNWLLEWPSQRSINVDLHAW